MLSLKKVLLSVLLLCLLVEASGQVSLYRKYHKQKQARLSAEREHSQKRTSLDVVTYARRTYPVEKDPSVYRILVLGGSAAYGFGDDLEHSWWQLLEKDLDAVLDKNRFSKVEIINLAQGASTTIDDYVNLSREGLALRPDLVIEYAGWNDLAAFTGAPGWITENTRVQLSRVGENEAQFDFSQMLRSRVYLIRKFFQVRKSLEETVTDIYAALTALRNRFFEWVSRLKLPFERPLKEILALRSGVSHPASGDEGFEKILNDTRIDADYLHLFRRFEKEFTRVFLRHFSANLNSIASLLKNNGVEGVFFLQPDFLLEKSKRELSEKESAAAARLLGTRAEDWAAMTAILYPAAREAMARAAQNNALAFCDFSDVPDYHGGEFVFQDSVHYTRAGNRLIAEMVFQELLKNNKLPFEKRGTPAGAGQTDAF